MDKSKTGFNKKQVDDDALLNFGPEHTRTLGATRSNPAEFQHVSTTYIYILTYSLTDRLEAWRISQISMLPAWPLFIHPFPHRMMAVPVLRSFVQ